MTVFDSHLDSDFCREMGEQLVTVDVPKSLLLKSNGSQGNPYRNNRRAMELHRIGLITARNGLNSGALHTAGRLVEPLGNRTGHGCVPAQRLHGRLR